MVIVASPSAAAHAAAGHPHPTYTEMITQAVRELGGVSATRAAIAEHIHGRFSGLPAGHDGLVSAHLRRLVAEGVLRTHGGNPSSTYLFAPQPVDDVPVAREKRGRGRPRKSPHTLVLPAKRKRALSPMATREDTALQSPGSSVLPGDDDSVPKTGPVRPTTQEAAPIHAGGQAVGGEKARTFQNVCDTTLVQSGCASSTGTERGRGRPMTEKPPAAAAMSPEPASTGLKRGRGRPRKESPAAAASGVFKRGCGRPRKDQQSSIGAGLAEAAREALFRDVMTEASTNREEDLVSGVKTQIEEGEAPKEASAAAATSAETGAVPSAGVQTRGGTAGMEESSAAAMSAQTRDAASVGVEAGSGTPRMEQPSAAAASPETLGAMSAAMSAQTRDAASAGVEARGGTPRAEQPFAAARSPETGDAAPAAMSAPKSGDAASTGVKRPRGRPRKNPATAMPAETGDAASTGIKRPRGRPRKNTATAMPAETGDAASTGVKRGRGRPRKNQAAMAAETGDAASTCVKRGRGRPRKKKQAAGSIEPALGIHS